MEKIVVKDAKYGFDLVFKKTSYGWGVSFSGVDWNNPAEVHYVNEMTIPWPAKAIEDEPA